MARGPNAAAVRAQNEQLQLELEEVRQKLAQTSLALEAAEAEKRQAAEVIPEPKRSGIKQHMLREHQRKYKYYLNGARMWSHWAHLNPSLPWKAQNPSMVHAYFVKMKEVYPELKCYENSWVIRRMVLQYFQNRRRDIARKKKNGEEYFMNFDESD